MDKELFYNQLLETLREEVKHAAEASRDAAEYATNEESRAESKWDTQGLEASYLAAGQAGQAKQWADAVEALQSEREDLLRPYEQIALGALFCCDFNGETEYYFLAGAAGGQTVVVSGVEVTIITPQSELANRLLGLGLGDTFELRNGRAGRIHSVE